MYMGCLGDDQAQFTGIQGWGSGSGKTQGGYGSGLGSGLGLRVESGLINQISFQNCFEQYNLRIKAAVTVKIGRLGLGLYWVTNNKEGNWPSNLLHESTKLISVQKGISWLRFHLNSVDILKGKTYPHHYYGLQIILSNVFTFGSHVWWVMDRSVYRRYRVRIGVRNEVWLGLGLGLG